jgi:NADH-quinone oxidoreductase subunit G
MIKVTIDDIEIEVEEGTTIMNAARQVGGDIVPPAMCYYSSLPGTGGKCRTCLVEVAAGSTKDPRPMPKLMVSCSTQCQDGMIVKNRTSERVIENRGAVVEFLLVNHPLDCPVCDQAGECDLQDLGFSHGKAGTRYEEERRTFEPRDIGDNIKLHMNRCILCYRCVHVANQLTDKRVHGVMHRGDHAEISTFVENAIENDFSGNMIDVCPVGALTDKSSRFKSRIWFMKPMDASCECSKCSGKAVVWMVGKEIYKVSTRQDKYGEVEVENGKPNWICDECRFDKKDTSKWNIEGPTNVDRHSVISQGHYQKPNPLNIENKKLK